jgi:hypothetical protein
MPEHRRQLGSHVSHRPLAVEPNCPAGQRVSQLLPSKKGRLEPEVQAVQLALSAGCAHVAHEAAHNAQLPDALRA